MLYLAMLAWIGSTLSAPIWYWVLWWIMFSFKVISFLLDVIIKGIENLEKT